MFLWDGLGIANKMVEETAEKLKEKSRWKAIAGK